MHNTETRIIKEDGELAVVIDEMILEELELTIGSEVAVEVRGGAIVLTPAKSS